MNKEMTTGEKAIAIIQRMVELANQDQPVTIKEDWKSKFGATVEIKGEGHTHVGDWDSSEEASIERLIDGLYNSLHAGPGLSFAKEDKDV